MFNHKILFVVLTVVLAACSTDVYQGEVQAFATDVTNTKKSFDTLVTAESNAFFERESRDIIAKKSALRVGSGQQGCSQIDALLAGPSSDYPKLRPLIEKCHIHYQFVRNGKTVVEPVGEKAHVENGRELLDLLNAYATNLAEVAAAKDIDALNASAAKLRQSVGSLIAKANTSLSTPLTFAGTGAITEGINLVSSVGLWVFQKYQEYRRFQVFKAAVLAANDAIQVSVDPLGKELDELNIQLVRNQMGVLNAKLSTPPKSKSDIEQALTTYEGLQILARVNGKELAEALANSHAKLKAAVLDPGTQKDALFAALKEFGKLVQNLRDAAEKIGKGGQ